MAKFRNLLVHAYRKVDNSRVFDIIQKDIATIREYLRVVNSFVNTSSQSEDKDKK